MTLSDPIADFLTRIRNAQMAGSATVRAPHSKEKEAIAQVMAKNDFLAGVEVDKTGKFPELVLTLPEKKLTLKRVSKPGQRMYVGAQGIQKVLSGLGIAVLSTSQGVMTGYEARAKNVGGEYLCEIS